MVSNYRYFLRVMPSIESIDTFVSIDDFDTFSIVSPITTILSEFMVYVVLGPHFTVNILSLLRRLYLS